MYIYIPSLPRETKREDKEIAELIINAAMEKSVETFVDEGAPNHVHSSTNNNNGGWISFPFIIGPDLSSLFSSPLTKRGELSQLFVIKLYYIF